MASFGLSRKADEDILAIMLYTIEQFGVRQAEIYHKGLHEVFEFLAVHPKAARERPEIDPPVRAHRYQSHLVVYEIGEDGRILILRVPHCSSDWIAQENQ